MKIPEKLAPILEQISMKINSLDDKSRYYLFGFVLLSVFILDYFAFMSPQLAALRKITPQISITKSDIETLKHDQKSLPEYRLEIDALKEKVDIAQIKVRSRNEVPLILEAISNTASKNKIRIDEIMPKPDDQVKLIGDNDRQYYSLPIVLEAKSSYHDFGRFLNQVEQGNIFLTVKDFTIRNLPDSKMNSIKLTLLAIVYEKMTKEMLSEMSKDKAKNKAMDPAQSKDKKK